MAPARHGPGNTASYDTASSDSAPNDAVVELHERATGV
jgi:hypothetical protein